MQRFTRLAPAFGLAASLLSMAPVSRAEEASFTPRPADKAEAAASSGRPLFGMGASGEPVAILGAREGGQLVQALSADFLVYLRPSRYARLYGGVGAGLLHVRARAGVAVEPLGDERSGPMLAVGVRPGLGAALLTAPRSADPPGAGSAIQPVNWAWSAIMYEGSVMWRLRQIGAFTGWRRGPGQTPDIVFGPTFLFGKLHYQTRGSSFGGPQVTYFGRDTFFGGTVSIGIEL